MTPKKKNPKKAGRKGKYNSDMPTRAKGFARRGLSEKHVAQNLGISEQTLNVWKNKFPEFLEGLREGQRPVNEEVENALLQRALGYEHQDESYSIEDKVLDGKVHRLTSGKKIKKHIPGDVKAMIFWLTNREKGRWKDKLTTEHEGSINITIDGDDANL